jgi:acyl CoA:acetate/3-ketoacid CoA transferase beta subunit
MEHVTNTGELKIVEELTYPATAAGKVSMIFTDLAVMRVTSQGLMLLEVMPGLTAEDVQSVTGPKLIISPYLKDIEL